MEHFVLPEFSMPFTSRGLNPGMDDAEAELWPWLQARGLVRSDASRRNVERARPVLVAALHYPSSDPLVLPLLGQWTAWTFIVDDELDDGPIGRDPAACRDAVSGLVAVLDGRPAGDDVSRAFAELWFRLTEGRSRSYGGILRESIISWLWTYYTEAVDRVTGRVLPPDDYRIHRRDSVGVLMFMDLCEQGTAIDLPDSVRRLASFAALRDASAEQIGLLNDVFSFRKEHALGYRHNLVDVLMHHGADSLQDAVDASGRLADDCVRRITGARTALDRELDAAALPEPLRRDACTVADHIVAMVRGDFDYHVLSERYADVTGTGDHVDGLFEAQRTR